MMNANEKIRNSFSKVAAIYDDVAVVSHEIGERLFERLHYFTMQPLMILDLGCATGRMSKRLKKLYPKATIIGLDLTFAMLHQAKNKQGFLKKWPLVCADMMRLPFTALTFDLIIANQVLGFSDDLNGVLKELNRVLKVNGCLMISTLGPDSLKEIHPNIPEERLKFLDMHVVGDALLAQQFVDPVVDTEYLTAQHAELERMKGALNAYGIELNLTKNVNLTYEIIYGHAWKGEPRQISSGGETFIPVSSLFKLR